METRDNLLQTNRQQEGNERLLGRKNKSDQRKYYQAADIEEEEKEYGEDDIKKEKKKPSDDDKSIIDLLRLPAGMHSRTLACKHKFGCFENTLRGMYRMFWFTFAVKTILGNLMLLISPAKLLKSL
jgi:hypothetical protein